MIAKVLLTDLGRVVVNVDLRKFPASLAAAMQVPDEVDRIDQLLESPEGQAAFVDFETGKADASAYHERMSAVLGHQLPAERFKEAHLSVLQPNAPVIALWHDLKRRLPDMPLIAVTNIDPWRMQYIADMTKLLFTSLVTSYEVGARKPDHAMFKAAIAAAGVEPHECLYVEDQPKMVIAAQECGLLAHLYDPSDPQRDEGLKRLVRSFFTL